jgi:AraC-like DNA-binding protein
MIGPRSVAITLTSDQVATVLRDGSGSAAVLEALLGRLDTSHLREALHVAMKNPNHSHSASVIRALLVLSVFRDDVELGLGAVAKKLGLSPSTTHRYLATWVGVGLLHHHPQTRKYKRMPAYPPRATST